MRKASAERGVRGSNLKDDNPVGAWNLKPSGAKEDKEDGTSTGSTAGIESAGASSTTMSSSSEQGAELGGLRLSSGSYTRQKQQQTK